MRRSLVIVTLVTLVILTFFSVWLVHFFSKIAQVAHSSQLTHIRGNVEYQIGNQDWLPAIDNQHIAPNTQLRIGEDSSGSLWLNTVSQIGLQSDSQLIYEGVSNGASTWELLSGSISGRYLGSQQNPLKIEVGSNEVTITSATFKISNTLSNQSVTVYDKTVELTYSDETTEDETPILIGSGETYSFTNSAIVESEVIIPADNLTTTATTSVTLPTPEESRISLTMLPPPTAPIATTAATQTATKPLLLTIGKTTPKITFIWINPNSDSASKKVAYRLLRSSAKPLDQKTATGFRNITGGKTSYDWALPDKNNTYYFRVCTIEKNSCTNYSDTITFLPENTATQ